MLIRLTPEQILESWDRWRPYVLSSLPPQVKISDAAVTNLLLSLQTERAQAWVYKRNAEEDDPRAILVTAFHTDEVIGVKSLLVYCFLGLVRLEEIDYENGIEVLHKFADGYDCKQIIAFVQDDNLVKMFEQIGIKKLSNLMELV